MISAKAINEIWLKQSSAIFMITYSFASHALRIASNWVFTSDLYGKACLDGFYAKRKVLNWWNYFTLSRSWCYLTWLWYISEVRKINCTRGVKQVPPLASTYVTDFVNNSFSSNNAIISFILCRKGL